MKPRAGAIVLVDWRGALPKEPNKLRPAVVVEDEELFDEAYPNLIVAPLTTEATLAIADLSTPIDPTPDNGCKARSFIASHLVTTVSKQRVHATQSFVDRDTITSVRGQIAIALGLRPPG